MTIEIKSAHTIKLNYSGYGKFWATWKGYDKKSIRKTIHVDGSHPFDKAGLEAAQLFTQWLTDTRIEQPPHLQCVIESITMGEISADTRVVLVRTDWVDMPVVRSLND